jgi:glycerol-3-phosphate dehydrogenase subunit B
MTLDLLIIGGGLAGLSAALTAAEAGLRVRVIAKGQGTTHWHTGALDLLGYLPGNDQALYEPLAVVEQLPPEHPYRRLGVGAINEALQRFQRWLAESDLGYAGAATPGANLSLPSPLGVPRPTWCAPQAQRAGDLSQQTPILIVGFHGLRDFYPYLIAENLQKFGYTVRAALLPLTEILQQRDFTVVQLAQALDEPATVERLATALKPLVQAGERVGLPAILGLHQHRATWARLQEQVGMEVFEIPTLPPSVPGIRLYNGLCEHLQRAGVRVEIGMEAIHFAAHGGHIRSVATATSARPLVHRAERYLLATGGLLGGGFNSDHTGRFWEVLFDLPLRVPPRRVEWFHPHFLHPHGQPIFSGGVLVDERWQPVDHAGQRVYDNLWAAGALLAHADPIRERSVEGLAITTGVAAAQAIVAARARD